MHTDLKFIAMLNFYNLRAAIVDNWWLFWSLFAITLLSFILKDTMVLELGSLDAQRFRTFATIYTHAAFFLAAVACRFFVWSIALIFNDLTTLANNIFINLRQFDLLLFYLHFCFLFLAYFSVRLIFHVLHHDHLPGLFLLVLIYLRLFPLRS